MSKKMRQKSAELYLAITIQQYKKGIIKAQEYQERIRRLHQMVDKRTNIYKNFGALLEIKPNDTEIDSKTGRIHITLPTGNIIYFTLKDLIIYDPDPLPSIPHIHDGENKRKINIYTGRCDNRTKISENDIVNMWNDEQFYDRLKKNFQGITSER